MKTITLSLLFLLMAVCTNAQTPSSPWLDGYNDSLKTDPGRGKTDWTAHHQFAKVSSQAVPAILKDRMLALKKIHSKTTYGRLYADITYLIASYGLKSAKWVNGADPKAPVNDPNRALLNWNAHNDYVVKSPGYDAAAQLISDRMNSLLAGLAPEEFARLYADCSILLINFSRMN